MQIRLDFRSRIPIYLQIIEQIKHQIAAGALHPGDQLPTVRQLATDLRVNFNTIARAYRLLDEAGIISTQHGRGTYILEPEEPQAKEKLREEVLITLTKHYFLEAQNLGFNQEEITHALKDFLTTESIEEQAEAQ